MHTLTLVSQLSPVPKPPSILPVPHISRRSGKIIQLSITHNTAGAIKPSASLTLSPPYRPIMAPLFRLLFPILLPLLPTLTTAWTDLSDETLARLPTPSDTEFDITSGTLLSPILIPRVPGTEGSLKVLSHFQNFFATKLPYWKTSTQNSTTTTPTSNGAEIPFVNFYATRDPPWAGEGNVGRLVLVAHYDSKSTPEGFIGATDSAVPCAVLMHAAQAVDEALTRKWEDMRVKGLAGDGLGDGDGHQDAYRGVMILFLDGEEAFHSWTHEDSLYGARYPPPPPTPHSARNRANEKPGA